MLIGLQAYRTLQRRPNERAAMTIPHSASRTLDE